MRIRTIPGSRTAPGPPNRNAGFIYQPSNGLVSTGNIFVLNSQILGGDG